MIRVQATKAAIGVFGWAEYMTTDPAASQTFYDNLFGWRTETADMEVGGKPLAYRCSLGMTHNAGTS